MPPRLRSEEEEVEREEQTAEDEPLVRVQAEGSYRVSGDVQVRAMELEQELGEQKAKVRAMEREVFAARRTLRNQRRLRVLGVGGLGALVGALLGFVAYVAFGSPLWVTGTTVVGFFLALLGAARWDPPDDDFPKAPPARTTGGML
jgi:F0F1-type ATP synthase assembly protein I